MADAVTTRVRPPNDYPSSDGRPMAESDLHRNLMFELIRQLEERYAADPNVHVSGGLLVYFEEGHAHMRITPDVFVVFGVPKGPRDNYLMWQEGKGPDVVIELTSARTRNRDTVFKTRVYRDVLGVRELFLFDPQEDYLRPSLQGYHRDGGGWRPIAPRDGRLPSRMLGLHLERAGDQLRLWDPSTGRRVPTDDEQFAAIRAETEALLRQAEEARAERRRLELEIERLRRERE